MFIAGAILGGLTIAIIVFLFVFLAKKQERLKKLPTWFYVVAVIALVFAVTSIGLVAGGMFKA